jgi:2-C-methyl-D-erythritol 2,4-cyclodiphosphate synthase
MLGGVAIDYPYGLQGHSDADVMLHAICDALLGAAALGDIGQHFPNTDPALEGRSQPDATWACPRAAYEARLAAPAYRCDGACRSAETCALPPEMRQRIARTLGILPEQVSIKATTNEGMDAVGERRAIACYAVATIYPANGEADHEQIPTQTD